MKDYSATLLRKIADPLSIVVSEKDEVTLRYLGSLEYRGKQIRKPMVSIPLNHLEEIIDKIKDEDEAVKKIKEGLEFISE